MSGRAGEPASSPGEGELEATSSWLKSLNAGLDTGDLEVLTSSVMGIESCLLLFSFFVLVARHLPDDTFDNYNLCGATSDCTIRLFPTADVADLAGELAASEVIFLGAEDNAKMMAYLGAHKAKVKLPTSVYLQHRRATTSCEGLQRSAWRL